MNSDSQLIETKQQIISALEETFENLCLFISGCYSVICVRKNNSSWSIVEQMEHLILSTVPIEKALALPKAVFEKFGKLDRSVLNYLSLKKRYERSKIN